MGDGRTLTFAVGTPLEEIERRVIHATLAHVGGDKRLCAQLLGIATRTIYRRLEEERVGAGTRSPPPRGLGGDAETRPPSRSPEPGERRRDVPNWQGSQAGGTR